MLTTELVLYLVTAAFFVFVIMNYYKPEKFSPVPYEQQPQQPQQQSQQPMAYNPAMLNSCGCNECQRRCRGQRKNINVNLDDHHHHPPVDPLRKFDYDAVYDDFTPPFRRSYFDYDYMLAPGMFPIYSRGPPGRFRKVGLLIDETGNIQTTDKYRFLNVMGREKYPGREFEYFATAVNNQERIKFYLGVRTLSDGDTNITIAELPGYSFTFKEDKDLSPLYDPYMP